MKKIPLRGKHGQGKFAQVDDEDYDFLMQWNWFAYKGKNKSTWYAVRNKKREDGRSSSFAMHRQVMKLGRGDKKKVDHKDWNGLNNQKTNLRLCNNSQNCAHRRPRKTKASKYLGVFKSNAHKKDGKIIPHWVPRIQTKGKKIHLGLFPYTPEGEIAAAKAYDEAAKAHHGEFANLNFKD